MLCAIISIGDELTTGTVVDSNSSWISDQLLAIGMRTVMHVTVGDDVDAMVDALRLAGKRAGQVIVTGGLGPTEDDLTRDAICKFAGVGLVMNEDALAHIKNLFAAIGREMTDNNKKQAQAPEGSETILNPIGTAPGFSIVVGEAQYHFLPGVPRECMLMMEQTVLPGLMKTGERPVVIRHLLLRTFGMTESQLDQDLKEVDLPRGVGLGYRAIFPEIHLKLIAQAATEEKAESELARAADLVRDKVGEAIYSDDGRGLAEVVLDLLREKGLRLCVAESCTGGLIAKRLTDVAGSSQVFDRGYITYSNQAKTDMLGVDQQTIEHHGAVSEECALAMAKGALERSGADIAAAVTGIAGPDGGTADKPVGTVHIALADNNGVWQHQYTFTRSDRTFVRELTAQAVLEIIRRKVLGLVEFSR